MLNNNKLHLFTGKELLHRPKIAASSISEDKLGFLAKQIGLHSACSGAAMAMYLAGIPVFTIILLGRWSSNAFLHYIHKQVKAFSTGKSSKMIENERFFTIPSASRDDLRTSNHSPNHSSRNKIGFCSVYSTNLFKLHLHTHKFTEQIQLRHYRLWTLDFHLLYPYPIA